MLLADGTEIVKAVAWPTATILIFVLLLTLARPATMHYIDRIERVKLPSGVEIDTRHAADRVQRQLQEAASRPDEAALTSLTRHSVDLGWSLARTGMRPVDYELTWPGGKPSITVGEPPSALHSDREDHIAQQPLSLHRAPEGYEDRPARDS